MTRAHHLSANKQILPKEEWTSFEDDQEKGFYLQPYLDLVRKENKEKDEWKARLLQ